jgi:hypothetical protein
MLGYQIIFFNQKIAFFPAWGVQAQLIACPVTLLKISNRVEQLAFAKTAFTFLGPAVPVICF